MFKKVLYTLFLLTIFCCTTSMADMKMYEAEKVVGIQSLALDQGRRLHVDVQVDSFLVEDVDTPSGKFARIILDDSGFTQKIGSPMLPVIRRFVQIPLGAKIDLRWKGTPERLQLSDYAESGYILPKQQPVSKCRGDKAAAFIIDEESYLTDENLFNSPAAILNTGVIRGHRFAVLELRPVNYNPATGTIFLYKNLEVDVSFRNADWKATTASLERYADMRTSTIVLNSFLNPYFSEAKTSVGYSVPGSYLVIGDSSLVYSNEFSDWVQWKTLKGFDVKIADLQETGPTAGQIQSYISNAYATWQYPPSFVLLVGDTNTIPFFDGIGTEHPATDLYYSTVDGNDMYADLGVGRFPAKNTTQLENMVRKSLEYEKALWQTDDTWLESMAMMASNDRSWVTEGTQDWVCSALLEPAGINCQKFYNRLGASSSEVLQAVNDGQNMVIYTGHGDVTAWVDGPEIYAAEVYGLYNSVYPFVSSYACLTGQYEADECFSETWLRAGGGAVAMWASSVSSFWDEDDVLERAQMWGLFNGTQVPEKLEDYKEIPWFSGFCDFAKIVLDLWASGSDSTLRYFEMYNLMGDPETMAWTKAPFNVEVSHKSIIGIPAISVEVQVDIPGNEELPFALVGISTNGELLAASIVHPGQKAVIQLFSEIDEDIEAKVVVTGHNIAPHVSNITFGQEVPSDDDDSGDDDIIDDDDSGGDGNKDRDDDQEDDDGCGC